MIKQGFKYFLKHPLIIRILARVIAAYIRFVFKTIRWQKKDWHHVESYWRDQKPFITCFWHNRLLMTCFAWQADYPFHMLISAHKDGQLIAQTVAHFNIGTVQGSTAKGGTFALKTLLKFLKKGCTIGITPDGPRGPRFKVSQGITAIARLSQLDIIPVCYATRHRIVLKSWDRFILALPFGNGVIQWGKPIRYDDVHHDESTTVAHLVEQSLNKLADEADKACGHPPLK